ncbi:hypothetical protein [Qipengyuania gelatinilytica]|uniref:Uncharacterized protein n=1 Tax=Qipengyuania gelatinilytica TaxID=2867231 RepID=A0ABX9A1S2_9SPHN|nr:hypothetical protein [Qipengyuania gelatinilytica]QZD94124.1 hypothetical protein K3136_08370 [Qipengyuania gelatinilytica]
MTDWIYHAPQASPKRQAYAENVRTGDRLFHVDVLREPIAHRYRLERENSWMELCFIEERKHWQLQFSNDRNPATGLLDCWADTLPGAVTIFRECGGTEHGNVDGDEAPVRSPEVDQDFAQGLKCLAGRGGGFPPVEIKMNRALDSVINKVAQSFVQRMDLSA